MGDDAELGSSEDGPKVGPAAFHVLPATSFNAFTTVVSWVRWHPMTCHLLPTTSFTTFTIVVFWLRWHPVTWRAVSGRPPLEGIFVRRVVSGVEYRRPLAACWTGTFAATYQRASTHDADKRECLQVGAAMPDTARHVIQRRYRSPPHPTRFEPSFWGSNDGIV